MNDGHCRWVANTQITVAAIVGAVRTEFIIDQQYVCTSISAVARTKATVNVGHHIV